MSNEFDAAVAASLQPDPAQSARVGFSVASDTNPDAYAEAQRVARRTGVPVDTALAMPADIKRQDAIGSIDFDTLAKTSPTTAALLSDVEKAKIAHDDVDNLSQIEGALFALGKFEVGTARAFASFVPKLNEGLWGAARAGADVLPNAIGDPAADYFARMGGTSRATAERWMPKASGILESGWYSGMQSLGTNVPLVIAAIGSGGSAVPVLAGMGLTTGGQAYGEARDAGRTVGESLTFGASQGAIEAGTEMIGLPALLRTLKPGKFLTKAVEYMVKEQGGEQLATHLQDLNEWAVLHPEKSVGDYLAERPSAALQTALATAFSGGGQLAVVKSIGLMTQQKEQDAERANQAGELLSGLNKLAEASKVTARDAQTMQAFFQSALDEGRDAVYITPEALAQSGLAEKLADTIPDVREQLQTAAEAGHDIRIPIADLMTRMAGPELEQTLIPHLAVEPGGFTPTTAQEYLQSGQAQELQAEVERALAEQDGADSFKASAASVTANIKQQLDTAARFTPQVNDAYATMVGNFYAVQAARTGTTPEAMFERYPLKIGAESVAGRQEFAQNESMPDNETASGRENAPAPEADIGEAPNGYTRLYTGSHERINEIHASGVFGGVFASTSKEVADSHGAGEGRVTHAIDIPDDRIATSSDLDTDQTESILRGSLGDFSEDEYDGVYDAVVRDKGLFSSDLPENRILEIFRADDMGEADWEVQRIRGVLAKEFGYQAVEMNDEHGTSYLVLPGVEIFPAHSPHEPSASVGSGVFNQQSRGAFNPDTLTLTLLKGADLSTFLHESGHFFLEVLTDLAAQPDAPAGVQQDAQTMLDWFGIKSLDEWNNLDFEEKRSYHERFARGFEAYLFEGKAPSIEMQGLLQRFRAWLLNVYRDLKSLNVEITDEVRSVFDRMLATTEQIKLAEQGRSMMPLFSSPEQAGMTPEEFAAYQALGVDATNEASQELQSRGLRDMQWLHNARGRIIKQLQREAKEKRGEVRAGVRGEVMSQPIYRAWEYLTGKDKGGVDDVVTDGSGMRWMAHGKLSISDLDAIGLPAEMIGHLKALRMTAKDGLHPDLVAEKFGFGSGDELVRTLLAATPPSEEIEALTDRRMLEQYGDLSSPEAIERAADKAIHNDVRARFVATEANALAKAAGQRQILASAAKVYAAAMIARLKVRAIKPGQYASAEARAAKAAEKASKAGDLQTAAAEKRNQLINNYATRAAYDAQEEVEAIRRKWSELANRADDKLRKKYDIDLINAVRAILGQYGIAEKKAQRAVEYLAKLETYDPEMYGIVRASVDTAEANAKPWREMTVEEVRGLAGELEAITHLARRSRQMEIDGDLMDREDVESALRARLDEIGIPDSVPGDNSAITAGEARTLQFKTALASMRRVESWVGKMDGTEAMGPFRRFVWNRIKDSADAYRADKAKYLRKFRDLFDAIAPTMKPGLIAAPELGYTFGKDSGGAAMNEIVHAILHTGNESNKRKLLLGRRWAVERVDGSLDTSRWDGFIARMVQEGKIRQEHFDFAQGVWDLLESTKPLAQKTHRDVFGKYFDEVTAQPFTDPFGVARAGGYAPAMADSRVVADAKLRALSEAENAGMAYAFPTTPKGFTKSRVEYNRPLLLDLRTLAQHIDKVLLFSHMEMPVRDVQRVISRIGGTLDRVDPAAISGMLAPWLTRSARQQVMTPIAADAGMSRFLATLRARAGAAAMFGNIANAVQQITGFSLAAVKVPPRLLLSSTVDYMKSPRKFAAAVSEASPYMADRLESEVSAMNDDINAILLNPSALDKFQAWTMRHAYFLQTAIDSAMSPIVWTAAYNQALEQGLDHRDAARLGDSAVRETQGSTLPEDIARIESGNAFVRLFTQFAGYFNMQANLLGGEFGKLAQDFGLRKSAPRGLYVLMFGFLAPAVVGELVMQVFRGGPPDDDKDGEYLDDWLATLFGWAPLRTLTAMVPVVGSAANAAINAWNSKPYDDRMATSPAISMLESAARAPVSAYKAIEGDGSAQKAVRDVATLISVTVGLPANLAARPLGYLSGVADGTTAPTGPADAVRGVVTGTASPQSKR